MFSLINILLLMFGISFINCVPASSLLNNELPHGCWKKNLAERIVNGNQTERGQIPYQCLVESARSAEQTVCGGVLLNEQFVLTAAHCCDGAFYFTVHLGAQNFLNHDEPGRIIDITDNYKIHQDYNIFTFEHDLCLIKLSKNVTFTDKIQPVKLPEPTDDSFVGELAIASGWGLLHTDDFKVAEELQYAELVVIEQKVCERVFGTFIVRDTTICAEGKQFQSVCNGDSGGPLVHKLKRILIGIVSFGHVIGCHCGYPQGFVRVTKYLGWISRNTGIQIY